MKNAREALKQWVFNIDKNCYCQLVKNQEGLDFMGIEGYHYFEETK
jgi:hypothetical protein